MGSPLAPTLASIFLSSIEDNIDLFPGQKPLAYKRYVDDIFLIFDNQIDIDPFLEYLNSLHPNIKFTTETENNGKLSFLDLLIERKRDVYETEIHRKKTDTGLYTTPNSFCESRYKYNMIRGLIFRSWSLSSTYTKSCDSINQLTKLLNKNGYSKSIVEKLTKETIDKLINKPIKNDKEDSTTLKYVLSIPYSEGFGQFKRSILKCVNNAFNLKIISQTYKIQNVFCNKSPTPFGLCSDLVYKFTCNGCNATYIGETSRHLCRRIQEHGRNVGGSNIAEHRKGCKSNENININDFKILCSRFKNYWERVACEALYIRSLDPKINVQTGLSKTLLSVFR